jgi:hypothetical protein
MSDDAKTLTLEVDVTFDEPSSDGKTIEVPFKCDVPWMSLKDGDHKKIFARAAGLAASKGWFVEGDGQFRIDRVVFKRRN